jgi:cholesterol transport system auxiliary component
VASATRDLVLAVNPPLAAPGFESSAIAYVQTAHVLDHYATHEWIESPARMIGQLLTRTLEDTGGFRAVVRKASGLPADLALDAQIVRLQQSFLTKPSVVEFTLRVQLVDVPRRRVLATRYIEVVEAAPSDDAPGGVVAANAAVANGLKQVAAFCIDAAADRLPPLSGRP